MDNNRKAKILVVDDNQALLDGIYRSHRKTFDLTLACGPLEGLKAIKEDGPFPIVVSDYQMPGMDGASFLARVQKADPSTVRIMLTGNADQQCAIEAVNKGNVFRFLTKPCPPEVFVPCMQEALELFHLRRVEQEMLEQTVRGSIQALVEVLSLSNPDAFGRSIRLKQYAGQIAKGAGYGDRWQLETAALLSQVGLVAVPATVVEKQARKEELTTPEQEIWDRHPGVAADLVRKIPRLEEVAELVAQQGRGREAGTIQELSPLQTEAVQIIDMASAFDQSMVAGDSPEQAMARLRSTFAHVGQEVLAAVEHLTPLELEATRESLFLVDIQVGMILDKDVLCRNGTMVLAKGSELTASMLERLRNYHDLRGIEQPLQVLVPRDASEYLESA